MTLFIIYLFKLLLNLFITTILVTDLNSTDAKEKNNITTYFFVSFFSLTAISLASILVHDVKDNLFYGFTLVVIFFVINTISNDENNTEKIKLYLISLCSILFGIGTFSSIMIGFISALVSYIILYNSSDFYRFFFSIEDEKSSKVIEKESE
jgi:hypothetical protein|tara:strand:+ start:563 stop:1018 length:456 start_codon:yes stop_codon:yes gene_type:complete